jgi:hypothetical protein
MCNLCDFDQPQPVPFDDMSWYWKLVSDIPPRSFLAIWMLPIDHMIIPVTSESLVINVLKIWLVSTVFRSIWIDLNRGLTTTWIHQKHVWENIWVPSFRKFRYTERSDRSLRWRWMLKVKLGVKATEWIKWVISQSVAMSLVIHLRTVTCETTALTRQRGAPPSQTSAARPARWYNYFTFLSISFFLKNSYLP